MSLGPEKILLILVVAVIVFGPQRLPEIARQIGTAVRELRRMQDTVRTEIEHVLHPDYEAPNPKGAISSATAHDTDHATLDAGAVSANGSHTDQPAATEDVTDDGFAGPRSFS